MSLIDLASMVLAPTAVKDGKVYNAIPNDQDFTFSRGTEATRINSAGLIEKARTNLLLQSNTITTSPWFRVRILSRTSGQEGYDGTNNAWLVVPDNVSGTHFIYQSVSGVNGVTTISVYAKSGGYNYFSIRDDSSGSSYARFDLSLGVTSITGTNAITSKIKDVGNGWYRCSLTYTETATGNIIFYVNNAYDFASVYTGDEVSGVYFQDFQVEQGLVSTDVITTTTSSVTVGITDDLPRVDYSGGGCPSLLLEPSRTNINTQSEYFGSSSWNKARMSITDNAVTSPEGVQNGANFVEDSTSNSHPLYDTFTVSSGTSYTVSMFVKKGSRDYFRFNAATSSTITFFNLANGTVHSGTGIIEDFGNGWYRCSMSFTATSTSEEIYIEPSINGSSANYQGDGSVSMSIYGFQLEAGSNVSSYIPSYGTSTSRSADGAEITSANGIIGQTQGVIFLEFVYVPFAFDMRVGISDGTSANYNNLRITSGGTLYVLGANSSVLQYEINAGALTGGETYKVALKYNTNDIEVFVNGISKGTDTSASPAACSRFGFDNRAIGQNPLFSNIKQTILFPTALTDTQLQELTT